MFIKTLRHKYNTIGLLLGYMVRGMQDAEKDMMIAHNLPSFDLREMKEDFLINDMYRQQTKATVRWYHEILSFSPADKEQLDTEKLRTLTQQYIAMRNPDALCFAVAHMSEAHRHVHLCFSGTEFRSKKTLRMDDRTFAALRTGMEEYQIKHFPELKNSIVYLGKEKTKERAKNRDKNARKAREYNAKKRLGGKKTEKQKLQDLVQSAYNKSENIAQFYAALQKSNTPLYERNGKVNGVKAKRKYRFSTLGITEEMLRELDRFARRQKLMERMRGSRDADGLER